MPIVVQCGACQKQFQAGDHLAGKQVKCPGCQTVLVIPGAQPAAQQPQAPNPFNDLLNDELPSRPGGIPGVADTKCPGCGAVVDPEAILCVECGYDFRKQKQIVPDTPSDRQARFEARADKMSGRDLDPKKAAKKSGKGGKGGEGIGWILFSFEGRIPRRVYWPAQIGILVSFFVCLFIAASVVGGASEAAEGGADAALGGALLIAIFVIGAIHEIAGLAVQMKRLHDRGRPGALVFLTLIPVVGPIAALWLFIEMGLLRGTVGPNEYGDDPT